MYSIDVQTGKLERWTESETGGLNTGFNEPDLIHWKSFDGHSSAGFFIAHLSSRASARDDQHSWRAQGTCHSFWQEHVLPHGGVGMIYPNVMVPVDTERHSLRSTTVQSCEGSYKDITPLPIGLLPADLDASRVLITGGSYGGFMTLAVATNYNDRICCSVDIVGISNLVSFLENTSGYRQDLRRVEYGDERVPEMRAFLLSISPMTKAKNITKPIFVIQGKNDPRVPMTESEQMVKTVRANGTPVWYLLGKDEGHGFQKKKNQDFQFYAVTMFMKKYLLREGD